MAVCLVTGGAGFIGSHLADALVARGDVVRVIDNFRTGALENLARARHAIDLCFGDLTNLDVLRRAMQGVELVFHLAAPPIWDNGTDENLTSLQSSLTNTMHVLQAAREAPVRRIVYASACEVYGPTEGLPVSESSSTHPLSPAGVTKLAEEESCVALTQHFGLETVGLRYFNVFGPRQPASSPYASVIPEIVKAMLLGRSPIVYGDGLDAQDFIYVSDVVHANLLASEAPRVAGKVYNIARGVPTAPLELVDAVNSLLGTRQRAMHAPPRPRGELHTLADIARAEVELGFCPSIDLQQGLRHCIEFYAPWRDELLGMAQVKGVAQMKDP